jgi:hypothetical protein
MPILNTEPKDPSDFVFISITYLLTYSMEQIPSWEANRFSASQEIPCILWNPKGYYRIHNSPPPVLSWACSIQSMPPHSVSRRSILVLSFRPRLGAPSGLFPSGFPTIILYTPLFSPIHATCPAYLILLDFIARTIMGEEYRSFIGIELKNSLYEICRSYTVFTCLDHK